MVRSGCHSDQMSQGSQVSWIALQLSVRWFLSLYIAAPTFGEKTSEEFVKKQKREKCILKDEHLPPRIVRNKDETRRPAKLAITGCGRLLSNKSPESPLISFLDPHCCPHLTRLEIFFINLGWSVGSCGGSCHTC